MKRVQPLLVCSLLLLAAPADAQRRGRDRSGAEDARQFWDAKKASLEAETQGWEEEAIDVDAWIKDGALGMKKTLARLAAARLKWAIGRYGRTMPKAEVEAVSKDLDDWLKPAADRLCAEITRAMKQAEEDGVNRHVLDERLKALYDPVKLAAPSAQQPALEKEVKALRSRLEAKGKQIVESMQKAAEASWAEWIKELKEGCEDLDPVACVKEIDAWKDKTVRLRSPHQMAGKQYAWSDFHLITSINGAPVAVQWDEELRTRVQAIEKATAVAYDIGVYPIEDMIGVVSGIAKVQGIEWDKRRRQWTNVGSPVDAPLLKMVAVKAGPFAVANEKDSMLEKVEGLDAGGGSSSDSSSSSSSSSKTKKDEGSNLALVCALILVLVLGIGGGVGGVLIWQQKQAAALAAGGDTPAEPPPAEPPPAEPPPPAEGA